MTCIKKLAMLVFLANGKADHFSSIGDWLLALAARPAYPAPVAASTDIKINKNKWIRFSRG